MPVSLMCPKCKTILNAPDVPGRQVRCPGCNSLVAIPAAKRPPEPEPVDVAEVDNEIEEVEEPLSPVQPPRPRRRLHDQDEDDGDLAEDGRRGYFALRLVASLFRIAGGLAVLGGLVLFCSALSVHALGGTPFIVSGGIVLAGLGYIGLGEFIRLALDIEQNTRTTTQLLHRLLAQERRRGE
jgi:hypothetical protein